MGDTGDPMAAPCFCLYIISTVYKIGGVQAETQYFKDPLP